MTALVLTAGGEWIEDAWAEDAVLPLADCLVAPAATAVRLAPTDDPAALVPILGRLAFVAIEFPVFGDGRGHSIAALLRRRFGFTGELRAVGDVGLDQLFALKRVGFSSFALPEGQDRERAVRALATFSEVYQGAADQPLPAFRRHARPAATEPRA